MNSAAGSELMIWVGSLYGGIKMAIILYYFPLNLKRETIIRLFEKH